MHQKVEEIITIKKNFEEYKQIKINSLYSLPTLSLTSR